MRILVTGGCGFIGSHICDLLIENGHDLAVVDNLSTGKRDNLNKDAKFYELDIRSQELSSVFDEFQPQAVYHEAAQISVTNSVGMPGFDADVNILGTIAVLEGCKSLGAKLVFASSAAVYGNPEYLGVDEQHKTNPLSPYGLSKLAAESYIRLYAELFGLRYTIFRYANVYGPRQDAKGEGGVVAIFADKARRGESLNIFGDGKQSRDFIHVRDVARANAAALNLADGETINIGSGTPVTINELCGLVSSAPPVYKPARPGDIEHSYFDNAKMQKMLKIKPGIDLKCGLEELL